MGKFLSAILSFLIPGVGQFYNRENKKALLFFVAGFLSFFNALLFLVLRLGAAYDAYGTAGRIERGEYEPPDSRPVNYVGAEFDPEKMRAVDTPPDAAPAALSMSKADVLIKTLLKITTKPGYYQYDEVSNAMAENYSGSQDWLTNEWVGRNLESLGFTEKRRVAAGTEVKLTGSKVLSVAQEKGLFD